MIEKIVESGLKTYYKEVCLLEQAFIHDSGKSVAQAVKEAEGKIGAPVKIAGLCAMLWARESSGRNPILPRGRRRQRQEVALGDLAIVSRSRDPTAGQRKQNG